MSREEQVSEIMEIAKQRKSNLSELIFILALSTDLVVTEIHNEFIKKK